MRLIVAFSALILLLGSRAFAWDAGWAMLVDKEDNPSVFFSTFLPTPLSDWEFATGIANAWVEETKCYRSMHGAGIALKPGVDFHVDFYEGITRVLLMKHGLTDARINRQPNGVFMLYVSTKASFNAAVAASQRHRRWGLSLYRSLPGVHYVLDSGYKIGTPPWAILPAGRSGAWCLYFGPFEDVAAARIAVKRLQSHLHIAPTMMRTGMTPALVQGFLRSAAE